MLLRMTKRELIQVPDPPQGPLLYGNEVVPERAGYATGEGLTKAWKKGDLARTWWLGNRLVSGQATAQMGKGLWKCAERLPTDVPEELLPLLQQAGVRHPASFADCYHQLAERPKILRSTYNRMLEWWPGGPWSEAKIVGDLKGKWWRYDLRQAYRWAATLGLPLTQTYRVRSRKVDAPGIWVGEIIGETSHLPTVFREKPPLVMSSEEIEWYKVRFKVYRGITWEQTHPADYVERTLMKLPCPNEAGRAYWGRWIARDPLIVKTSAKEWELKVNPWRNFVWGWLIVGRVRHRVWQVADKAAHVYVDEVILPHELEIGPDIIGSWRPKAEYPRGLTVYRLGHFGEPGELPAMRTGEKRA